MSNVLVAQTGLNPKYSLGFMQYADRDNASQATIHYAHSFGIDVPVEDTRFLFLPGIHYRRLAVHPDDGRPFNKRDNLHMLFVPVCFGYKFIQLYPVKVRVFAGGHLSLMMAADDNSLDLTTDRTAGVIPGIQGGVQLELTPLTFDVRWVHDLRHVILARKESRLRGVRLSAGLKL